MKEVIDKIVKVEQEARQKLERAREQAGAMILEAESNGHKLVETQRQDAYKEKEELLEKVQRQALEKKKKTIEDTSKKAQDIINEKSPLASQVADKFFKNLSKIDV